VSIDTKVLTSNNISLSLSGEGERLSLSCNEHGCTEKLPGHVESVPRRTKPSCSLP